MNGLQISIIILSVSFGLFGFFLWVSVAGTMTKGRRDVEKRLNRIANKQSNLTLQIQEKQKKRKLSIIKRATNGDGKQSRDFTYIENVIEANLKACLAPSEAAGEAFNIAYGGREYLIDIYYGLTKALGVSIEPNFGPDRKGDIKHSNADISKARELLGYDPDYSFADGIKLAIEWYKENL